MHIKQRIPVILLLTLIPFISTAAGLGYKKKRFVRSRALKIGGKTISATMKIYYPVLKSGARRAAIKSINRFIRKSVLSKGSPNTTVKFNRFFKAFRKYTRDAEHPFSWNWTLTLALSKDANGIITVTENWYAFTGGAHPNFKTEYYSFKPSGKRLILWDIIIRGKWSRLNQLGERYFRRARNINPGKPYSKLGLWGKEFKLNSNFRFTKRGLLFRFNSYDIAPYAFGPTTFTIPFGALKPFLKKQYLGKRTR